jgi:two-component system, response regulator YesN
MIISKMTHKKSNIFYKYLISYFIVFFLPIILTTLVVFNYIFISFEQEVIKNNYSTINNIKSVIDVKISELHKIKNQAFTDITIISYANRPNFFKASSVVSFLKNIIVSNDFILEVLLYTSKSDYLISSVGSYNISNFVDSIYDYAAWKNSEFTDDIVKNKKNHFRPAEEVYVDSSSRRIITGIYHDISSLGNQKSLIFLIDDNSIHQILSTYRGNTVIIDNNENIITATENASYLNTQEFYKFIHSNRLMANSTLKLENTKYFISYLKSEDTGWTYVTLLPVEEVMSNINNIKIIFIYSIIVVFILGSIIILLLTRYQYNPIKKLKSFAENNYGESISNLNELEAVRITIASICNNNKQLKQKIKKSHPALKEFMLTSFLKGNFRDINDFNNAAEETGLHFSKPFYFIASIMIDKFEQYAKNKGDIALELEHNVPNHIEGYCKSSIAENKYIMILSTENENENIRHHMQKLQDYLAHHWNIYSTIGISSVCSSISDIWKSFIESSTAADYRLIYGRNSIILFDEIENNKNNYDFYSDENIKNLTYYIKNADYENVGTVIDNLVKKIKGGSSLFTARCLCFNIINNLMSTVYSINKSFVLNENDTFDLESLMKFDSVEELADTVKIFCIDICEYVETIKTDNENNLFIDIKKYIDDHCCACDFSIQTAAEMLEMSQSNLGQYFKSHTGINISEYICNYKIERAKDLLNQTDKSIKDIVMEIGYLDSSNFIRKFKNHVGITPGDYRKISKESEKLTS